MNGAEQNKSGDGKIRDKSLKNHLARSNTGTSPAVNELRGNLSS
jgi:hypothetical protein